MAGSGSAQATGRASAIATNGTMLDLTGAAPAVAEYVETGRIYLDGTAKIGALDGVVRDRIRMALNGHVLVTLILDEDDEFGISSHDGMCWIPVL